MTIIRFLTRIFFAAIFMFVSSSTSFADSDSKPVQMETITITATKSEKNIDGVSASVVVVGQKEIEMMGAYDLKGIFEKTPGLTIQYGTFPAASSTSKSSISIRGLGFFGTLFLIDGRRLANELPSYDLDRIPASMIERIEIIKGPMSVLYGADAVGGVVNIITKKPKKGLQADIDVKGGMNSDGDAENTSAGFNIRGKWNDFGYVLYTNVSSKRPYTERETTDTFIKTSTGKVKPSVHPNSFISQNVNDSYDVDVTYKEDSKVFTVGSRFEYNIASIATVGAEFNYFDEDLDGKYRSTFFPTNPSVAKGVAFDIPVHSTDDNNRLDWGIDSKINIGTDLTLNLRIYRSDYEKSNTTTAIHWENMGYSSEGESEQTRMAMNANVVFTSYEGYGVYALTDSQFLTIGGEYRDEERRATIFNNEGTLENRDIDYKAVYVQDEWQITDTLSAIFGGRYDDIENADSEETFMAGFVKNFSKLFNLRANFAQGYRTPNILELYFRKATPVGYLLGADVAEPSVGKTTSHELNPEFTNSYEAALSGKTGGLEYELAFFYNDIKDLIQKIQKVSIARYFTYENVSDAETMGLEAHIGYQFKNGVEINLNWLELDTENKETGKDLEFNPERTVSLNMDYHLNEHVLFGVHTVYAGEQHYTEGTADQTTNDYTLVNLTASYTFGDKNVYEIYGGVNNIFDEDVDAIIGSNVGPCFYAGLRASF